MECLGYDVALLTHFSSERITCGFGCHVPIIYNWTHPVPSLLEQTRNSHLQSSAGYLSCEELLGHVKSAFHDRV